MSTGLKKFLRLVLMSAGILAYVVYCHVIEKLAQRRDSLLSVCFNLSEVDEN
ncbi:hypothetical protein JCM15457_560 [Liquorilactobacillus sucicola DSM 21376 = JCM 15457]|uniref:Uncharacterized protein n=1 Tax=Liquorilactobacillus sucicola DSM 21376 = JCM 15457 TaxID=1423806 RepID=A0A023CUZ2_9LACO|nr:hypothetical protein FD15_GL002160 [Liquorilactobacillus sucicola DSM 21376 = JCM 15457]GAJ25683.1 hypothetical protein JCM15457_560 [Liquorilactobacillus sucicola DSM 21376 = JCM 15457]